MISKITWYVTGIILLCAFTVFLICNNYRKYSTLQTPKSYKEFVISSGTYNQEVKVLITDDTLAAVRYVTREADDSTVTPDDFKSTGICFFPEDHAPIMWLSKIPETPEEVAAANHELLHLTIYIMTWVNIPLSDSSEEAYTYELQYLSKEFYNKVR